MLEELTLQVLLENYRRILTVPIYHWFLFAVFADVVTGSLKALKTGVYDSRTGSIGLRKHLVVILLVLFTCPYLKMMDLQVFSVAILTFYIVNYAISILENLEALGVPFPAELYTLFNRIGERASIGNIDPETKRIKLDEIDHLVVSNPVKKEDPESTKEANINE